MKNIAYASIGVSLFGLFLALAAPLAEAAPFYQNQPPSCTIELSEVPSGYPQDFALGNGYPMLLTWSSGNASAASISPELGSVPPHGSQIISAWGQTYSMSVYSTNGRTSVCQTTSYLLPLRPPHVWEEEGMYAPTFSTHTNYPTFSPDAYISEPPAYLVPELEIALTQIPYTGADFGLLGGMLAWLSVIMAAACGAFVLAERGEFMEKIAARLKG